MALNVTKASPTGRFPSREIASVPLAAMRRLAHMKTAPLERGAVISGVDVR
jgi:hypothetical protein